MPADQTPMFKKAVEESRKLKAKPTQDELLEVCLLFFFSPPLVYGLFFVVALLLCTFGPAHRGERQAGHVRSGGTFYPFFYAVHPCSPEVSSLGRVNPLDLVSPRTDQALDEVC